MVARPDQDRRARGAGVGSRVPSDPALLAPDARLDLVAQLLATAYLRRRSASLQQPSGGVDRAGMAPGDREE
jgi:hypothetical protein